MKKLGPGCNETGWTTNVKCEGDDKDTLGREVGCGAPLEIEKNDLYSVHQHDITGPRDEVRFTCPCGIESVMRDGDYFTNLPTKAQWLANKNH